MALYMSDHRKPSKSIEEEPLSRTTDTLPAEGAIVIVLLGLLVPALMAQDVATGRQHHDTLLLLANLASSSVALQALLRRFFGGILGNILPRNCHSKTFEAGQGECHCDCIAGEAKILKPFLQLLLTEATIGGPTLQTVLCFITQFILGLFASLVALRLQLLDLSVSLKSNQHRTES